jgi:hypothetical protein
MYIVVWSIAWHRHVMYLWAPSVSRFIGYFAQTTEMTELWTFILMLERAEFTLITTLYLSYMIKRGPPLRPRRSTLLDPLHVSSRDQTECHDGSKEPNQVKELSVSRNDKSGRIQPFVNRLSPPLPSGRTRRSVLN